MELGSCVAMPCSLPGKMCCPTGNYSDLTWTSQFRGKSRIDPPWLWLGTLDHSPDSYTAMGWAKSAWTQGTPSSKSNLQQKARLWKWKKNKCAEPKRLWEQVCAQLEFCKPLSVESSTESLMLTFKAGNVNPQVSKGWNPFITHQSCRIPSMTELKNLWPEAEFHRSFSKFPKHSCQSGT